MGAAVNHFFQRNEIKNNFTLVDLQEAYFRLLLMTSLIFRDFLESKTEPYQFAKYLASQDEFFSQLYKIFPEILTNVKGFWGPSYEIGELNLQDEQLKANFAGDPFPSYSENTVSCSGLYVDTMILPYPILKTGKIYEHTGKGKFCFLLMKHVLT